MEDRKIKIKVEKLKKNFGKLEVLKGMSIDIFEGEVVVASGEWLDSDNILVSKCIVLLSGQEFSETIPVRRSRRVNPAEIPMNSELLVYGYYLGTSMTEEGMRAVIRASGIRKLN